MLYQSLKSQKHDFRERKLLPRGARAQSRLLRKNSVFAAAECTQQLGFRSPMICRNVIFHPWASLLVLCLVLACSTAQVVNLNHLSPQGCPQVVHNFTLAHGMLSMVGTRFTLYGEAPGSSESNPTYDYDGSLSMNIVSVNQQHTYDKTAHCNPINDPTLYSVRLSSCTSCQPNYLDAYGPGWKETTVSLVLSDCSDTTGEFNNLTMIINATTTNQTHSITYTNTMANSTYPTLTYTTPYV